MVWAHRFWLRLQTLFRRDRITQRLDDEIQFHLDQQIAENISAGMSPDEARYAAQRTFGNPTFLKEKARDTWGWIWLDQAGQDLRYGLRTLRNSPNFTAVAVLTLALGIGANTAIFSLLDGLVLRDLCVPHPEQLVRFGAHVPGDDYAALSLPMFQELSPSQKVFRFPGCRTDDLLRDFEIASLQAHGAKRILATHALFHLFTCFHLQVGAQLLNQLPVDLILSEQ